MGCPTCGQKYRRPPTQLQNPPQPVQGVNPNKRISINGVIKAPVAPAPPKPVVPPQT